MNSNVKSLTLPVIFATLFTLCFATNVSAQGVLIPDDQVQIPGFRIPRFHRHVPPAPERESYRISELSIDASVKDQIAQTQVSQTFVNTGSRQMEVSFVFPLPYDGAIDQLSFMVDGKELPARLLPADKAREIYEGYVRRYKDPALLEWIGTGMFKTSVFPVPAGASRTVSLKYSQLLKKELNAVDYLFPLSTAKYTDKPIDRVSLRLSLHNETPIKNIYSPTHKIDIKRDDDNNAVVKFEAKDAIPVNDFRLIYDTAADKIGASVISYWPEEEDQGYFILMASPAIKKDNEGAMSRKSIQFVVDRSGSMVGRKIDQAREAAKFVLNNLNDDDLFNVIAYDSAVVAFNEEIQRYDKDIHSKALGFINSINAGGSTNISEALKSALNNVKDDSLPSYIVFLTDGLPTVGETNEMKIVEIAKSLNKYDTRLIAFGVGYDVNSRLIDRLTNTNHGQSEYVRPDEDIEQAVGRLYQKIASPVFTNVRIDYEFDVMDVDQGEIVNRVYPSEALDIFAGGQLIVVGRYKESGTAKIKLAGKVGDAPTSFEFDAQFADKGKDNGKAFVEKLWASRRIGQIIDEIDLNGKNDELVKELITLSIKHGILTQYTSFLADEHDEANGLSDARRNFGRADSRLRSLEATSGRFAFGGRVSKQQLKGAQQLEALIVPLPVGDRGAGIGSSGGGFGLSPSGRGSGIGAGGGAGVIDDSEGQDGVRQNKSGTMYKRGNVVIAANAADVDLEKAEITDVERYSKEYFDLINGNTKSENEVISQQLDGEELVIRLRGKIYRFK